jgi:hypothetical protein
MTDGRRERIELTLKSFSWGNYGLDDVGFTLDDPDTQDWVTDLASEIMDAL